MKLLQLNEDVSEQKAETTRSRADFNAIKEMGGGSPKLSDIVMIVKDNAREIVGFMITKPYRETAYTKKYGVAKGYGDDLIEDLLVATLQKCSDLGFKHCTNRTTDNRLKAILKKIYGDPYKVQKFKHKTANRYKINLSELGPPIQQKIYDGGSENHSAGVRY